MPWWRRLRLPGGTTVGVAAQVIMALTGVAAFFVVWGQLSNLRSQNEILTKTLSESYRPVGSISRMVHRNDTGYFAVTERLPEDRADRFGLKFVLTVRNVGEGILIPCGIVTSMLESPMDRLLPAILDNSLPTSVEFHEIAEWPRPMPPGAALPLEIEQRELPFAERYYFHALLVYSDIAGKYYASEYILKLSFEKPSVTTDGSRLEARLVDFRDSESYWDLSAKEVAGVREKFDRIE